MAKTHAHTHTEVCSCGHIHNARHNACETQQQQETPHAESGCCAAHKADGDGDSGEEPRRQAACCTESKAVAHTHDHAQEACCDEDDGCNCGHEHGVADRDEIRQNGIRLGISAALFVAGLLLPESLWKTLVFAAAYLVAGLPVVISAVRNIFSKNPFDETLLMTIATIGAAAMGDFAEAAAVMILFGVGELLQDVAVGSTKRSISSLLELRPDAANLLRDGVLEAVDPALVQIGDIVIVKPYERVPLDGVVIEGESYVDESALTGESVPIGARVGKQLLAGGINGDGALTIRVGALYADSAVNKIIRMTEEAARQKSPREKFITRFARIYTPAVVALAVLVAVVPPLLGLGSFREWIYTALTLLVISCPCALVISVPLAFFAGLGGASRAGILVRGSTGIEALAKTKTVAFDKTGTLTKGEFAVTDIAPHMVDEPLLLELCAYAESLSTHPIGKALVARYGQPLDTKRVDDIVEVRGRGVSALVDGVRILAGNRQLLQENGIGLGADSPAGTVVYVARAQDYIGHITLGDTLKEDAARTVGQLRQMGIRSVMLTGDNEAAAQAVAQQLEVDDVYAGLLPGDKVAHIQQLKAQTEGSTVFVGDGINDAPVIAAADVGVSMGGLGSDAAIEASDVVLMTDEPGKIITAIRASRRTLRIVTQNILLALGIKGVIIVLGLFGISSMWLAIVADVGAALLAVANSVRALRVKE